MTEGGPERTTSREAREAADLLLLDLDWLVTVDAERRVIRDAGLAVKDGRFAAVGKSRDVERAWTARLVVRGRDRVALPGLIDSHLHSSFQLSRGLADEVGTRDFLFKRMFPYEGAMSEEDVHVSALFAAMELLRHGVTCFVDPGNYHPEATGRGVLEAGMRAVLGRSAFDLTKAVLGILPAGMIETTDEALERTRALLEHVASRNDPRLTASVSFRGLSNASDALILGCKTLADEHGCVLQTHACFNYSTHDDCIANFGLPEIERLESLGVLDERMLLAHSGWLEPREVELVLRRRPSLVAAPSSSLHNGYGNLARGRFPELMALGVNVGIGSDHACSGITDLVQELFLFSGTYKELCANPRVLPPEAVVEMATVNGARCAGLADRLGSVEVGKEADLVLFDTRFPEWQPLYNPVSNLVYSATGGSVSEVFVAGECVVEHGRLTRVDEAEVLRAVRGTSARIAERIGADRLTSLRWPVS
ncbi:MAG TPA: amidohydrolase family protein [Gammaproteobacteria bacterium]|nr:amidohydrolase family protein [Gammaproteobacteria bacterium]